MYTGGFKIGPEVESATLIAHMAECLRRHGAAETRVDGDRIDFSNDPSRFWTALYPFGTGTLSLNRMDGKIRSQLSARTLLIDSSIIVGFMAMFVVCVILPVTGSVAVLLVIPFMWLWFVGGNLAIGIVLFRRLMRRAIATAPRH
jgi:hypothetical protein